ncbi:hypothetical protein DM01DRAFT_1406268, partial [Hesseltinella vesiculosa]
MDDLLDLDWTGSTNNTKPVAVSKSNNKQDMFADLLAMPSKKQTSTLTLHQQRMATATFSSTSSSPIISSSPMAHSPVTTTARSSPMLQPKTTKPSNLSSPATLDAVLNPFAKASQPQPTNMSMNALRSQTSTPTAAAAGDPWDLDFLANSTSTPEPSAAKSIDPFDVDSLMSSTPDIPTTAPLEDENPLGVLARPIEQCPQPEDQQVPVLQEENAKRPVAPAAAAADHDQLLAQLVDMGFGAEESSFALEACDHKDLQSAIDLIVQNTEAMRRQQETTGSSHTNGKQKQTAAASIFDDDDDYIARSDVEGRRRHPTTERKPRSQHQQQQQQPRAGDASFQEHKDRLVSQASVLGGYLYKNASLLVKSGKEKINKAMDDWQQQPNQDPSQPQRPRWMQQGALDDSFDDTKPGTMEKFVDSDDDDDELANMRRPSPPPLRQPTQPRPQRGSPALATRKQRFLFDEDENDDQYVSPSRRSTPPRSSPRDTPPPTQPQVPFTPTRTATKSRPKQPVASPAPAPPQVEATVAALSAATQQRERGNEQYKLGQFDVAEQAYSTAIQQLPTGHLHLILLYNNRAMVGIKTGHYKQTVDDCDQAIVLLQTQQGVTSVHTQGGVVLTVNDHFTKALSRKAEALEHMEKYPQALQAYEQLAKYEGSANTKTNQAMARCRRIVHGPPAPTPSSTPATKPSTTTSRPIDSEAVKTMRAQAAQQEADDAERLAKTDSVNERLNAWKNGKETNLRALLATLGTLLWEDAHWPSIQMSDLIQPKRCKINYLKAISKVHPDKLPASVTVEQRMIASGVFSTLNEAWDAFKTENNL